MNCHNHPEKEATCACVGCGKLFCSDCTTEIHGKSYCKTCLKASNRLGCLKNVTITLISILLFLIVIIVVFGDEESGTSDRGSNSIANTHSDTEKVTEYTPYDITAMIADLGSNALKAETVYQNAYIEITGVINNIDSDGKYITLIAKNDKSYGWDSIRCSLINDEQRSIIINKSKGDTITIRGQITSIGEVIGYTLDIHTIK